MLESKLKLLPPVLGTLKNLLIGIQVRIEIYIDGESFLILKSRWNVWPVLVGECLHEIQRDGR